MTFTDWRSVTISQESIGKCHFEDAIDSVNNVIDFIIDKSKIEIYNTICFIYIYIHKIISKDPVNNGRPQNIKVIIKKPKLRKIELERGHT